MRLWLILVELCVIFGVQVTHMLENVLYIVQWQNCSRIMNENEPKMDVYRNQYHEGPCSNNKKLYVVVLLGRFYQTGHFGGASAMGNGTTAAVDICNCALIELLIIQNDNFISKK